MTTETLDDVGSRICDAASRKERCHATEEEIFTAFPDTASLLLFLHAYNLDMRYTHEEDNFKNIFIFKQHVPVIAPKPEVEEMRNYGPNFDQVKEGLQAFCTECLSGNLADVAHGKCYCGFEGIIFRGPDFEKYLLEHRSIAFKQERNMCFGSALRLLSARPKKKFVNKKVMAVWVLPYGVLSGVTQ